MNQDRMSKGCKILAETKLGDLIDTMESRIKELEEGGGGSRTAEAITITANGVTNTPEGKYYDPITVNVPSGEISPNFPSWYEEEAGTDYAAPPAGTKAVIYDSSHSPARYIETFDGETQLRMSSYVGKIDDNNIFVYIYNG